MDVKRLKTPSVIFFEKHAQARFSARIERTLQRQIIVQVQPDTEVGGLFTHRHLTIGTIGDIFSGPNRRAALDVFAKIQIVDPKTIAQPGNNP